MNTLSMPLLVTAVTGTQIAAHVCYLASVLMFIFGIMMLSKVKTARRGNLLAAGAMLIAVVGQLIEISGDMSWLWVILGLAIGGGIGGFLAITRKFTEMPELVALFNGTGGLASVFVALATFILLPMPEGFET